MDTPTILSGMTLLILAYQEVRVGVPGARATLVKTLQDTINAQAERIDLLADELADLRARLKEHHDHRLP